MQVYGLLFSYSYPDRRSVILPAMRQCRQVFDHAAHEGFLFFASFANAEIPFVLSRRFSMLPSSVYMGCNMQPQLIRDVDPNPACDHNRTGVISRMGLLSQRCTKLY